MKKVTFACFGIMHDTIRLKSPTSATIRELVIMIQFDLASNSRRATKIKKRPLPVLWPRNCTFFKNLVQFISAQSKRKVKAMRYIVSK